MALCNRVLHIAPNAMPLVDTFLKDGNLSFEGGADASRPAASLARNQFVFATNSTSRGSKSRPRPAFVPRHLSFASSTVYDRFRSGGRFQHADFYNGKGEPTLISSQGGRLFSIRLRDWKVSEITCSQGSDVNSASEPRGWSVTAENYWIYQDNQSAAIIYNGTEARRSLASANEIPTGNVMAYTMGRLAVSLPNKTSFRIGDLVFGDGTIASLLRFTENEDLNTGGEVVTRVFGSPFPNTGEIRAMKAMAMNDTSLGQGPLIVGTPGVVFSVDLPFDRAVWKQMTSPLKTVNPILGPLAQDSTILINGDLWYRSVDGIRSYIQAVRDFNSYSNTPVSRELGDLLEKDNQKYLEFGSAALWNNYAIWTISPRKSSMGTIHDGLAVINFDGVSNLRQRTPPSWDGIWTGLNILKVVSGVVDNQQRCFVFALNADNEIELWELDDTALYDGENSRIERVIETPAYNFGDGFGFKELQSGELFIEDVQGEVDITVRYRPDQHPCWVTWDSFDDICATMSDCLSSGATPRNLRPQYRSKLRLPQPSDDFDEINGRKYRTGYEFQTRIEITGNATLNKDRLLAKPMPESANAERDYQ